MTNEPPQSLAPAITAAEQRELEGLVRQAGSSFYWAMRRLPPQKRQALYAIYAFCREVDDIADEPGMMDDKQRALQGWSDEVAAINAGHPTTLIGRGLLEAQTHFGILCNDLIAVIAGMETDAPPTLKLADDAALTLYIDQVACAVGRLCVRVFGLEESLGIALAKAQGEALQLTNILRDVAEDAGRDRIYIPADLLREKGVPDDIGMDALLDHPGLKAACGDLSGRALEQFLEAERLITQAPRDLTRPSRMMLAVYRATFDRLMQRGWRDMRKTVRLGKAAKLWIALRHGVF